MQAALQKVLALILSGGREPANILLVTAKTGLTCRLQPCGFLRISGVEALLDPDAVNAQEFVLGSDHADKAGLALGPFLIQEPVHRLVSGRFSQISADDLVKRLRQTF